MKYQEEAEKLEARRKFSTARSQQMIFNQEVIKNINEANEICRLMSKNIKFMYQMVKVPLNIDSSGRMMSMRGSTLESNNQNFVEEI